MSESPARNSRAWIVSRRSALAITLCALAVLALSSGRAFHMDDTIYVRWAHEITSHFPDPYPGEINWYGIREPIPAAMRNPPAGAMALALAGALVGWSERALHLAQLLPSAVFLLATWALARRWCSSPLVALALVAVAPVFLVMGASVMADTLTAAAWMCAILCWCRPESARSTPAGVLAVLLAALTKWYGLLLVPLLIAWELLAERRLTRRCLWLLLPLAATVALEIWTRAEHGVSVFSHATSIAVETARPGGLLLHGWIGLAFLGGACAGCFLPLAFLVRSHARWLIACALVAGVVVVSAGSTAWGGWSGLALSTPGARWLIALQLGLWGFAGAGLLAVALRGARESGPEAKFLALWIALTVGFFLFLNWGVPVRSFLPVLPGVAIALVRALDRASALARPAGRIALGVCLATSAAFGLCILRADSEVAEEARDTARALTRAQPGARVWFQGHWGFQHYAEAAGARALDRDHPDARTGDIILVPMLNTNIFGVSPERTETLDRHVVPLRSWFVVLGPRSGAGFWADVLGPLPFAWNQGEVAETWVFAQK